MVNNDPLGDSWQLDLWGAIQVLDAQDDGRAGGNGGAYGSAGGYGGGGYGDGAMAAYSSYGMWPGAAARFASLANYGAHWSFGGHADYSGAIAAGNAILGERAAARELLRSLAAANDFKFNFRLGANGIYVAYQYTTVGMEDNIPFAAVTLVSAFVPFGKRGSVVLDANGNVKHWDAGANTIFVDLGGKLEPLRDALARIVDSSAGKIKACYVTHCKGEDQSIDAKC